MLESSSPNGNVLQDAPISFAQDESTAALIALLDFGEENPLIEVMSVPSMSDGGYYEQEVGQDPARTAVPRSGSHGDTGSHGHVHGRSALSLYRPDNSKEQGNHPDHQSTNDPLRATESRDSSSRVSFVTAKGAPTPGLQRWGCPGAKMQRRLFRMSNVVTLPFFLILAVTAAFVVASTWMIIRAAVAPTVSDQHNMAVANLESYVDLASQLTERTAVSLTVLLEMAHHPTLVTANDSVEALCSVLSRCDTLGIIRAFYAYSITQGESSICSHSLVKSNTMAVSVTVNGIHQDMYAVYSDNYTLMQPPVVVSRVIPGNSNSTKSLLERYGTVYIIPEFEQYFDGNLSTIPARKLWRHRAGFDHVLPFAYPARMFDTQSDVANNEQRGRAIVDAEVDLSPLVSRAEWLTTHGAFRVAQRQQRAAAVLTSNTDTTPTPASMPATNVLVNDGLGEKKATFGNQVTDYTRVFVLQTWGLEHTDDPVVVSDNWGQQTVSDASEWSTIFTGTPAYLRVSGIDDPIAKHFSKEIDFKSLAVDGHKQRILGRYKGRRTLVTAKRYLSQNSMPVVYVVITVISSNLYYRFLGLSLAVCGVTVLCTVAFWFYVELWFSRPLNRIGEAIHVSAQTNERVILKAGPRRGWLRMDIKELSTLLGIYNAAMAQIGLIDTFMPVLGAAPMLGNGDHVSLEQSRLSDTSQSFHLPNAVLFSSSEDSTSAPNVLGKRRSPGDSLTAQTGDRFQASLSPTMTSSIDRNPVSKGGTLLRVVGTTVTLYLCSARAVGECESTNSWSPSVRFANNTSFSSAERLQTFMQYVVDACCRYGATLLVANPDKVQMVFCKNAALLHQRQKLLERSSERRDLCGSDDVRSVTSGSERYSAPQHINDLASYLERQADEAVASDALDAAKFVVTLQRNLAQLMSTQHEHDQQGRPRTTYHNSDVDEDDSIELDLSGTAGGTLTAADADAIARRRRSVPSKSGHGPPSSESLLATGEGTVMFALLHTQVLSAGWITLATHKQYLCFFHGIDVFNDLLDVPIRIGAPLLMTEQTYQLVSQGARAIPVEALHVRATHKDAYGVVLYELLPGCATTATWHRYLTTFCGAFACMLQGNYAAALDAFLKIADDSGIDTWLLPRSAGDKRGNRHPSELRTNQIDRLMSVCREHIQCNDASPYVRRPHTPVEPAAQPASHLPAAARTPPPSQDLTSDELQAPRGGASASTASLLSSCRAPRCGHIDELPLPLVTQGTDGCLSSTHSPQPPPLPVPVAAAELIQTALPKSQPEQCGWQREDSLKPTSLAVVQNRMELTDVHGVSWVVGGVLVEGHSIRPLPNLTTQSTKRVPGEKSTEPWAKGANVQRLADLSGRSVAVLSSTGVIGVAETFPLLSSEQERRCSLPGGVESTCAALFPRHLGSAHTVSFLAHLTDVGDMTGAVGCIAEYHAGGTLRELMLRYGRILPERLVARYAVDVFSGLAFLHSKDVVHGAVRPENVLAGATGTAKLRGFFGNRATAEQVLRLPDNPYVSPDVTQKQTAEKSDDVYSAGLVLLEMLTGQLPWRWRGRKRGQMNSEVGLQTLVAATSGAPSVENSLLTALRNGQVEVNMPPCTRVSEQYLRLLEGCLNHSRLQRPTASEALQLLHAEREREGVK